MPPAAVRAGFEQLVGRPYGELLALAAELRRRTLDLADEAWALAAP
jgi:hypothetical protein